MGESDTTGDIETALSNLSAIKSGNTPQTPNTESTEPLDLLREEIDRLFEEHEMPKGLSRDDVHVYVADWKRRIGNAKYHTRIPEREHGRRISGRVNRSGEFSIGVAKRAFDAKDTWIDTARHELAHVTAYKSHGSSQDHNHNWKREARLLGATPTSCARVSPENRPDPNYYIACPNGCYKNERQKASKIVKYPSRYRCKQCKEHIVTWAVENNRPTEPGTSNL